MKRFVERITEHAWPLLTLLVTLIGLYYAYRQVNPEKPQLLLEVKSVTTPLNKRGIDGLSGELTFKGKPVSNLSVLTLAITNSGGVALIGRGPRQNIVGEALRLPLSPDVKLIDVELRHNQADAKVLPLPTNSLAIQFEQWKPRESILITVYVDGTVANSTIDIPSFGRQIIEGNASFVFDSIDKDQGLAKYLGQSATSFIRAISGFVLGVVGSAFVMLLVLSLVDRWRNSKDRTANRQKWLDALKQKFPELEQSEIEKLAGNRELVLKRLLEVEPPDVEIIESAGEALSMTFFGIVGVTMLLIGFDLALRSL